MRHVVWLIEFALLSLIQGEVTIRGLNSFVPCKASIELTGYTTITCTEKEIGTEIPRIQLDGWVVNEVRIEAGIKECKAKNFNGLKELNRVNLTMVDTDFERFSLNCFLDSTPMFERVILKGGKTQMDRDFVFDYYFHEIHNVRILKIDSIRLRKIPKGTMKHGRMATLERLTLVNTDLNTIDPSAFEWTNLREIVLDGHDPPSGAGFLHSIAKWISPLDNLEVMRFRNIPFAISADQAFILDLRKVLGRKLRVLEFDNCEINDIGPSFNFGPIDKNNLRELILRNNPIESSNSNEWLTALQKMANIERLEISNNKLPLVQPNPNWMRRYENFKFKQFILTNNQIEDIPSQILPVSVEMVNLSNSSIFKASSTWLRGCAKLQEIILDHVKVEKIFVDGRQSNWGSMLNETKGCLRRLSLMNSSLKSDEFMANIPIAQDYIMLEELNLKDNQISRFVDSLHEVSTEGRAEKKNLTINLANNRITRIQECNFYDDDGFESIRFINLTGNPLICDCKLVWAQTLLKEKKLLINCGTNEKSIFSTNQMYTVDLSSKCLRTSCSSNGQGDGSNGLVKIVNKFGNSGKLVMRVDNAKLEEIFNSGYTGANITKTKVKKVLNELTEKDKSEKKFWLVTWSKIQPEPKYQRYNGFPDKDILVDHKDFNVPLVMLFYHEGNYYLNIHEETIKKETQVEENAAEDLPTGGGKPNKKRNKIIMICSIVGGSLFLLGIMICLLLLLKRCKGKRKAKNATGDEKETFHLIDENRFPRDNNLPKLPGHDYGEYVDARLSDRPRKPKADEKEEDLNRDELYYDDRAVKRPLRQNDYFETYGFVRN